jgi:hypothetical protein
METCPPFSSTASTVPRSLVKHTVPVVETVHGSVATMSLEAQLVADLLNPMTGDSGLTPNVPVSVTRVPELAAMAVVGLMLVAHGAVTVTLACGCECGQGRFRAIECASTALAGMMIISGPWQDRHLACFQNESANGACGCKRVSY